MLFMAILPASLTAQALPNKQTKNIYIRGRQPIQVNATEAAHTVTILKLHGKSEVYQWHPNWVWQYEEITKYDNKGRLTLDIQITDTINHDTSAKTVNIYFDAYGSTFTEKYIDTISSLQLYQMDTILNDLHGNDIKYAGYAKQSNNEWILDSGVVYKLTYNSSGLEASSQEIDYNTNNNTFVNPHWANTLEINYIYDSYGNNVAVQFLNYKTSNKTWEDSAQWVIDLNTTGSWQSITIQGWNGAEWVNQYLEDSAAWNNWKGGNIFNNFNNSEQTFSIEKRWNGTVWIDENRNSTTYNANGGNIVTTQEWAGNKWINVIKTYNMMDSLGNRNGFTAYEWSNSAWVESSAYLLNYTYDDSGNITQAVSQFYDSAAGKNVYFSKEEYGDFSDYTGIKQANQPQTQISLYPNPATETIHLQENITSSGDWYISVINMQGQVVISEQTDGNKLSAGINIPVNNLADGIYMLRAISGIAEICQKFIKE